MSRGRAASREVEMLPPPLLQLRWPGERSSSRRLRSTLARTTRSSRPRRASLALLASSNSKRLEDELALAIVGRRRIDEHVERNVEQHALERIVGVLRREASKRPHERSKRAQHLKNRMHGQI